MASSKTPLKTKVAIAFSGGLDSTVLLHTAIKIHGPKSVYAFHVHHGIMAEADSWQEHCAEVAKSLRCHFDTRQVVLQDDTNIEAQARTLRYAALYDMCQAYGIEHLLLAHHQDDQIETMLLQMMRGAGVAGMAGMPAQKQLQVGDKTISVWRPFLDLRRSDLESYATENRLPWIEDPSNQDEAYRRNAVRKKLLPAVEKVQEGAVTNMARSAKHLAEAQDLLQHLADIDLALMEGKKGLSQSNFLRLYKTHQARAKNALRRWLAKHGLPYPSEERLQAWCIELERVRADAKLQWQHAHHLIRLWKGHLTVEAQPLEEVDEVPGQWVFEEVKAKSKTPGIALDVFNLAKKQGLVNTMPRQGGEKFKVDAKRPHKSLKNLFQEAQIPPWQRDVPLLYIGDELVAVSGIGLSAEWSSTKGPRISPVWRAKV